MLLPVFEEEAPAATSVLWPEPRLLLCINAVLHVWLSPPCLQVFSVLPLHGELQPGQSQRLTCTFSGLANTVTQVTALCRVEGGPSYEVALRGEASCISYVLDRSEIDCGLQVPHAALVRAPCLPPSQLLCWLCGLEVQALGDTCKLVFNGHLQPSPAQSWESLLLEVGN